MNSISISGVIVSAEFDQPCFADWIEKGVITPSSRILSAIADGSEPLDIRINSYGGDVFAGGEILNAIVDSPREITLSVGAIAASMAANIVLLAKRPTRCHENSIFLFHSAHTEAEGGAGALRDEATMIDAINEPMKARLLELGADPATVEEGFAEGRQYTFGAPDALALGLVTEIISGADTLPQKPTAEGEPRLAALAFYAQAAEQPEPTPAEETPASPTPQDAEATLPEAPSAEPLPEPQPADETAPAPQPEPEPQQPDPENAPEAPAEPSAPIDAEARISRIQSKAAKEINRVKAECDALVADLKAQLDAANEKLLSASEEAKALREELAHATAKQQTLVGAVLAPRDPAMDEDAATAMRALKAEYMRLPPRQAAAFLKAHPQLLH